VIARSEFKPPKAWDFCGVVLSGGQSDRMGAPKAGLILPDGRSMIEQTRDTLASFCQRVVFVGSPHGVLGHGVIEEEREGVGPLAGIEAVLASGFDTQYLVVPCDLPLAQPGFLARLTRDDSIDGMTVFHVEGEEMPRPLPCRIGADCLEDAQELIDAGEYSVKGLIERLGPDVTRVDVAARERDLLLNVNTPEDFERACALLRSD
jgi:molybdopterin-guanine dinucleotide biosynthesis protein A